MMQEVWSGPVHMKYLDITARRKLHRFASGVRSPFGALPKTIYCPGLCSFAFLPRQVSEPFNLQTLVVPFLPPGIGGMIYLFPTVLHLHRGFGASGFFLSFLITVVIPPWLADLQVLWPDLPKLSWPFSRLGVCFFFVFLLSLSLSPSPEFYLLWVSNFDSPYHITHTHTHTHIYIYIYICKYIYIYIYKRLLAYVPAVVKTTLQECRGGHYSFPCIAPLYPWYVPYIAEC